jgi:hypothetical protein
VSEERDNETLEEQELELERRLAVLDAEGSDDPARKDIPAIDFVLLAALVVLTTVVMFVWGY